MEVQKEAQRIMTLSVWKMYHSRLQRGGLRLHRSLQLSLVMRSARELYLSAKVDVPEPEFFPSPADSLDPRLRPSPREAEAPAEAAPPDGEPPSPEPMDTQEETPRAAETPVRCDPRPARVSRKRRSSSLSDCGDAGLVPSKKARLEEEEKEAAASEVPDRLQSAPAQAEGAFPNLARVLQRRFSGLLNCSPASPPSAPPACEALPACRPADNMLNVLVRTVVAF
ncbi:immediate early response gene 2 protein [Perognathus longimembris pacificus]|uniref:immediate early response gene 2 protein n=1 Tax=Perognathus longimembris pacificus TaxID=214514 RepID=UPI002018C176|nr:immediate early response gene 2 protein [Perognathus longimembris pacificus]